MISMTNDDDDYSSSQFTELSFSQKERLAFIDLRLYFLGDVSRRDIVDRFQVGPAVATRDFAKYRELFPQNLELDRKTKKYVNKAEFRPSFQHKPERALTALTQGFGDGVRSAGSALVSCEFPVALNHPNLEILAQVTRAIHKGLAVEIVYSSFSSGDTQREVVPFSLVNDGMRWHVRAFDRRSQEFRDFVFTRMQSARCFFGMIEDHEKESADEQWNRILDLEIIPHPKQKNKELIEMDFGMQDGQLNLKVRAANAGYILRHWNVDCSLEHYLDGIEYRLCLKNPLSLYNVKSAVIAPGYSPPTQNGIIK